MLFHPLLALIVNLIPFLLFIFYQPSIFSYKQAPDAHTIISYCIMIIHLFIITTYFFLKNIKIEMKDSSSKQLKKLSKVTELLLLISTFLLLIIVISGLFSFQGNVFSSQSSIDNFKGIRILIHLKNVIIPLSLSTIISSYYLSHENLQKQFSKQKGLISFWQFSTRNYPKMSWLIVINIFLSGLYSLFFAERMFLYETLISVMLPLNLYSIVRFSFKQIIGFSAAFMLSFMAFEFSRNFYVQYIERGQSNLDWDFFVFAFQYTLDRLFLYYIVCVNRLAFVINNNLGGTSVDLKTLMEPLITVGIVDGDSFQDSDSLFDPLYFTRDLTNIGGLQKCIFTSVGLDCYSSLLLL